jgi:hypothetical protein
MVTLLTLLMLLLSNVEGGFVLVGFVLWRVFRWLFAG